MPTKDIFVRGIEEKIFLKFKGKAVESKKTVGKAFNEAMILWLEEEEE